MFLNNKKQRVFFVFFFGNPNGFNYICSKSFNITFMKLSHIEHIGIAVKDLATVEEVKDQKVKTAFFMIGQTKIELLESTDPEGPIGKFIEKKGEGVHHIAFAVEGIENALEFAAEQGVQLIDKAPRKGAEGLSIAFLHPKSTMGVLTELCEDKNK